MEIQHFQEPLYGSVLLLEDLHRDQPGSLRDELGICYRYLNTEDYMTEEIFSKLFNLHFCLHRMELMPRKKPTWMKRIRLWLQRNLALVLTLICNICLH